MPHVFFPDRLDGAAFARHALPDSPSCVRVDRAGVESVAGKDGEHEHPTLTSATLNGKTHWLLLAGGSAVRINGRAPLGGLAVLNDRDEISWPDGTRGYFSTETPVAIERYPGPDTVKCPSCYEDIEEGQPAVRCPCGVWYHQGERLCFTHYETCRVCGRPTKLDGEPAWSPGALPELGS
jgi:hypothetical protein